LYRNIRYVDDEKTQKCVLPCTPLAIVKILEHLNVYDKTYVIMHSLLAMDKFQ
jgi:methylenetetrahydrofolate dehydrogenase (NAD+)